eukprot:gene18229-21720_t
MAVLDVCEVCKRVAAVADACEVWARVVAVLAVVLNVCEVCKRVVAALDACEVCKQMVAVLDVCERLDACEVCKRVVAVLDVCEVCKRVLAVLDVCKAEKTVVDGLRRSATSASWPQLLLPADPSFEALYDESRSVVWEKIQRRVDSAGVGAAAAAAVATADSGDPPPKAGFRVVCHAPMRVLSPRPAQQLQSRGAASSPRHKLKANASSLPYQLDTGVAVEAAAC